jgi:hypothetical protein
MATFQAHYDTKLGEINKKQADRSQPDRLFSLQPPKWAREGATKFTDWLSKTSLKDNEMEKALSKMMTTANSKSGTTTVETAKLKGAAVMQLEKGLDTQVKVIKAVRGVSGIEYNYKKTRLGWTDSESTIWLLLTFEGKMKTCLNCYWC